MTPPPLRPAFRDFLLCVLYLILWLYVFGNKKHKKKEVFIQLLESPISSNSPSEWSFARGRPSFWQPRKGHEKCIFETLHNEMKCVLSVKELFLFFLLIVSSSPHSYCAPPPARARSGHWPPPHVSENWSIIQIANTTILSKYHNFIHEPKTKYHTFIQIPIIKFAKPHFYPKTKIEVGPVNVFLKNSSFSLVCIVCSSSW